MKKLRKIVKITFLFITVSVMLIAGYAAENVKEIFEKLEDSISCENNIEIDRYFMGYRKVVIDPT